MLQKLIVSGIAMSLINSALAQDSLQRNTLTVSGSADLYYKYDFGKTKANTFTSFTASHNSFELGMGSVKLDYKMSKLELVADLGLGKRARDFSYNDEGALAAVKQLYISYSPIDNLRFTAGTWATHVGYELVDPRFNRNYSMSYMFTNGPFSHTGIKAEVSFGKSTFMLGLTNPPDYKYVPDNRLNSKFAVAQYAFTPGDFFKMYLNYVGGENVDTTKTNQFDLVLNSKLSDQFSLGYNGTINRTTVYIGNKVYDQTSSWWGSALYINFDPTPLFGITLREEYFNDDHKLKMFSSQLSGGNIWATTFSANLRTANLILIPEVRIDNASREIFTDKTGAGKKTAANILLAAIYYF